MFNGEKDTQVFRIEKIEISVPSAFLRRQWIAKLPRPSPLTTAGPDTFLPQVLTLPGSVAPKSLAMTGL